MKLATKLGVFTVRSGAPALLLALAITHVCAQEPPPPDGEGFSLPPPDGAGDFGGPPPGGPQRQMRRTMPLTPAIVPESALTSYLKLSADQSTRLADILERLRLARPRPGGSRQSSSGADAAPAMPSREEMEAARPKFEAAITRANQEIASLLHDRQTKRLATLLKAFKALQSDSISLNAAARLRLTDRQIESLAVLGASPTRAAVTESFTPEQIEIADLNRTQLRRGPPGGGRPGGGQGFGPPPGGGPGFGPPDGGGPPF